MDKLKFITQDKNISILFERIYKYSHRRHFSLELNQQKNYLFYKTNEKKSLSQEELEQRKEELRRQKAILLKEVELEGQ